MTTLGRCKCCAWQHVKELNKRLAAGDGSLNALVEWCASKDFRVTRQKLADHKAHITDPRQTFVENARSNPAIKANVSRDEFLQSVIDVSAAKIAADPDSIGVSHGLKAVQILEGRREKQVNLLIGIARVFTALPPSEELPMIEGEYREVPALEDPTRAE